MAVNVSRFFPLQQAKQRRINLTYYLKLDGSRYLLGVIVLLCLMSMIALGQTGVVATKGYAIVALEQQRTELLRERSQLELRLAAAQSLEQIRARAEQIGLRPMTNEQVRYVQLQPSLPLVHAQHEEAGGDHPAAAPQPAAASPAAPAAPADSSPGAPAAGATE